ncbi:hypothetical protein GE061_013562 [Apolygus lucorum]|uniref:Uncharacterized protein n=1 Tax=Apolygus lucorum TaxID=248454 RepID=A0A6A4JY85_APOLU|nr:hypothetical protein GE061_013562 [Apolygus lucorum]
MVLTALLQQFLDNFGKPVSALGHLLIIVNLEPTLKAQLCPVLLSLLGSLSISLAAEQRYEDLLKCYEEILGVYGDNEVVLNNIGSQLYRFSHLKESRLYLQKACEVNPCYLPAFRNLQNVTNVLVERWHFRMLNDTVRNETFRAAIVKRAGKAAPTAIDIGTGTGLLSLYLKQSGAEYVFACDYSSVMTYIAQQVFDANLPPKSVMMVNKLSTDMRIPNDIPFRCSLVVTETMDSGLLGEHLLSTLDHAWDHLLLPPAPSLPRVIPSSATVFGTPIQSNKIARKNRLLSPCRSSETCTEHLDWSGLSVRQIKSEPYDTENLYVDDCRYLSEPVELFSFNFNDPQEIKQRLRGEIEKSIEITFTQSGYLDAIAVWFEANLDDDLKITTSPLSSDHCTSWHHAIFPCDSNHVVVDSKATLVCKCDRGVLNVRMDCDISANQSVISLDESVIRFLNSPSYLSALSTAVTCISLDGIPINRVIDMSLFPHQGLLLSKNSESKLLAINDLPIHLIKKLIKRNKIKSELVTRQTICDIDRANDLAAEEKYDLLIVNFIESRGEISQDLVKLTEEVIDKFLKPDGAIIPQKTEIWGQLVSSTQLINENRVTNPRLESEFVLNKFINEYRVSTHLDVNMKEVDFQPLSEPFLIGSIPTRQMYSKDNLTWEVKVPVIHGGQLQAIFYWFNTVLYGDVSYSSASDDSFASQAAEVLPGDIPVSSSDIVILKCLYSYGVIKLDVV